MKNITSASFVKGVVGFDSILERPLPQIAFVGRSNVGKSSIINTLTGQKKLAISSSTPGRTLQLNFFLINNNIFFVDLPGYGFSITSMKQAEKMRKMILWYLESDKIRPEKVVLVIDAKVGPTKFDLEMMELLQENHYDIIVVANKIDKVKTNDLLKKKRDILQKIDTKNIIAFSSKTKEGRNELLARILN